jgi:cellulose synthase/poly-beta-1,6-N-acetylglucosamine synthase-like glycosyltransferase
MLTDWTYWLSCKHPEQLLALLWALLLIDSPRYALGRTLMVLWDGGRAVVQWLGGQRPPADLYCPSVCVVIAAHNEAATVGATLASVWGSYPRLEVVVVDDGSGDGTAAVARRFARVHPGVLVLRRPRRGGKPSALNFALAYARAEVVVFVDADSHLAPDALWRVVQPLRDPAVGAVSATVRARNPFAGAATWLQAYEYLSTIFVGRLQQARLGLLAIVSGAFGAYRREVLLRCMGADVELAEDMDLTLRARRAGYRIAFVQRACCFTNVPASWPALARQRLRWEESSILRLLCRKHVDMAEPRSPNFRWSNLLVQLDFWFFNVACVVVLWAYAAWLSVAVPAGEWGYLLLTLYAGYAALELLQVLAILYYSENPARDLPVCTAFVLAPAYQLFLFALRSWALVDEALWRRSYALDHIPAHVREATWRW